MIVSAKFYIRILPVGFFLLFLGGGAPMAGAQEKPRIPISIQGKKLMVEVAQTEKEKALGLMYREHLGKDEGMLFIYEQEEILSFWMKNTRIPLSIAFLDRNGKIVDIQDMQPFSLKVHFSRQPAAYALEVNQGWFQKNGIGIGNSVNLPPELRK